MEEIELHLFVKNSSFLVSLAQPKPIMEPNARFLILAWNPTIEAIIYRDPMEFEVVIWLRFQKRVYTRFVLGMSDDPDLVCA